VDCECFNELLDGQCFSVRLICEFLQAAIANRAPLPAQSLGNAANTKSCCSAVCKDFRVTEVWVCKDGSMPCEFQAAFGKHGFIVPMTCVTLGSPFNQLAQVSQ
jgi:hypothetical protein